MSDRDRDDVETRDPKRVAAREPDATLEDELTPEEFGETLGATTEFGPDSEDPMPDGPNEDGGFDTDPPADVSMNRTSDDNDLNPSGGGFTDTPLRKEYETIARRDDLSRGLEDLIAGASEWAHETGSTEAHDVVDLLTAAYERLGAPSEDTDDEPDIARAEPGAIEAPGRD